MTMLYCEKCHKGVVIMGVSLGAASDGDVGRFRDAMAREGQLVIFNPPPFERHRCPSCASVLVEREGGKV